MTPFVSTEVEISDLKFKSNLIWRNFIGNCVMWHSRRVSAPARKRRSCDYTSHPALARPFLMPSGVVAGAGFNHSCVGIREKVPLADMELRPVRKSARNLFKWDFSELFSSSPPADSAIWARAKSCRVETWNICSEYSPKSFLKSPDVFEWSYPKERAEHGSHFSFSIITRWMVYYTVAYPRGG